MQSLFRSAVTVCLVPEASQGPFVFHGNPQQACKEAKEIGFDSIELFPPSAEAVKSNDLRTWLDTHSLGLAAIGSGAGWVTKKLSLTSKDSSNRELARKFIFELIDLAGPFQAPVIIGSMQGRVEDGVNRDQTLEWLATGLNDLSVYSFEKYGTTVLYEPLNRYETNIFNRMVETGDWLTGVGCKHVKVLVDLFHANIEEASIAHSIELLDSGVGHIHFADSNRHAVGFGHTEIPSIIAALRKINYQGYLSAEVFPRPDSISAAKKTIDMIKHHLGENR